MIDFRALFAAVPTPVMVLDRELRFVEMNQAYLAVTQRSREELVGRPVFEAFPEEEERLKVFRDAFTRVLAGEHVQLTRLPFYIPRPEAEGGGMREVWWTCAHSPLRDASGEVRWMIQHATDVTATVKAEEMRRAVERELEHRVRNIFALVMVIARRSADHEVSATEFLRGFEGRIEALARTHGLLTGNTYDGMEMDRLVREHLKAYLGAADARVTVEGPKLWLDSREAQAVSMALYELASNAAKHGALADGAGRLAVRWEAEGERGFALTWAEHLPAPVAASGRKGFGSVLLSRVLPKAVGGEVAQDLTPEGMRFRLSVPRTASD